MKYKKGQYNIFVHIALSMLLLIALTLGIGKNLYAKYITKDSDGDSATVAKFEIDMEDLNKGSLLDSVEMNFDSDNIVAGTETVQEVRVLEISNKSEVAVDVSFIVFTSGNLPLNFLIEGSEDESMVASSTILDSSVDETTKINDLYRKDSENVHLAIGETIYVKFTVSFEILDSKYSGFVDLVNLKIVATQTD